MNKLFWILLWLCSIGFISFGYAQSSNIQTIYDKIDTIVSSNPELLPAIQNQIQSYTLQQTDPNKKAIMSQINIYVQSLVPNKPFEIGSHIDRIPAGYKSLSKEQMTDLSWVVHIQWEDQWPIRVLEFIDFQCPFCQRQHNSKVLENLTYIEYPWKVRSAAVMFPLTGKRHELATAAAESAECAYRQGGVEAFYAHKDGLYAAWLQPWPNTIARVANNNWLDTTVLQTCLDTGAASQAVQDQKNRGRRLWVTWTPGTVVIDMRTWAYQKISWAVPLERFMPVIEKLYKSVE